MNDEKKPLDLTALAKVLVEVAEGRHGAVSTAQSAALHAAVNVLGELVWEAGK